MSAFPAASASLDVWPRGIGSATTGPTPLGGGPVGLPTVNNPNLPSYSTIGGAGLPPPVPQPPLTPFPAVRPALNLTNSNISNNYTTANTLPSTNPMAGNPAADRMQNEAYQRRLTRLEDENFQRKDNTGNLTQLGSELIHGQMEVQEQILQYQFMLEECMDKLDNQNYVLNEQEEQLSSLRSKIKHLEYLMDAFKYSKEGNLLFGNLSQSTNIQDNPFYCCGDPLSLPAPSTSPFFAGGPTRATSSTFQPFNPRYRSPNSRATTAASLNSRRSMTPPTTRQNLPFANQRPARRLGNVNN